MLEISGISPQLYQELQAVLLSCDSFESEHNLRLLFVDNRISFWRHKLPSANSAKLQVQTVIDYLLPLTNTEGKNALVLFLHVLRDNTPQQDTCYGKLTILIDKTDKVTKSSDMIKPPPQSIGSKHSVHLNNLQKRELAIALLACPTMQDRQSRDTVINELPDDIKTNIRRNTVDRVDVTNLVTTCLNYPNGLSRLIESLQFYEGNSLPMQQLEYLKTQYGF